ncbi:MAG TPA: hypothetical protein VIF09_28420 [Polyangiaceae bacterium]
MTQGRDDWRVRTPFGEVVIDVHPTEGIGADQRQASVRELEGLVQGFRYGDRDARRIVLDLHARLQGLAPDSTRFEAFELDTGSVRIETIADEVLAAGRSGALVLRKQVLRSVVVPIEVVPEAVLGPSSTPPEADTSWIAIELLGEDGKPIPYQSYQVTLADGSVLSGSLDNTGKAMIRDIAPGQCAVTFPDLDQATWAPA